VKRRRVTLVAALAAVALAATALLPLSLLAATVRSGGQLVVAEGETLAGNSYLAGVSVEARATTTGDLAAVGYSVRVQAPVGGDLTVVSGSGQVLAAVAGDLRIAGGFVVVDAAVQGDLVVVGGNVQIGPGAKVGGDLVLVAGAAVFEGDVRGVAKVASGQARIDGSLGRGGDVTVARGVTFGPKAAAGAAVAYFSPAEAVVAPEASALRSLLRHNRIPSISETGVAKRAILQFLAFWHLLSFISNLLLGLAIAYGSRAFAGDLSREFRKKPGRSLLAGLGVFVLAPAAAALATVSLFAMPVGVLILLAVLAAGVLAAPLATVALGRALLSWHGEPARKVSFREVAVGAVALALLGLVPQAGFWLRLVLGLVAVGAATRVLLARVRGPSPLFQALSAIRGEKADGDGKGGAGQS